MITAPAITVGTLVSVDGIGRAVVAGFGHNHLLVSVAGGDPFRAEWETTWSLPCAYNRQLARGTGRHERQA